MNTSVGKVGVVKGEETIEYSEKKGYNYKHKKRVKVADETGKMEM